MNDDSEAVGETREIPLLLHRRSRNEIVGFADGTAGRGWARISANADTIIRALHGINGAGGATSRRFVIREQDLHLWDKLIRLDENGYALGVLHDEDGKFASHVRIKEVSSRNVPGITPGQVACAAAFAQIQASLDHITAQLDDLQLGQQWIIDFLGAWQEGDVIAASETLSEVHLRYIETGVVSPTDWNRVAHLEQVIKSQHRRVIIELTKIEERLRYRNFKQAKASMTVDACRVEDLFVLEAHLLRSLSKYTLTMLARKAQHGQVSEDEVSSAIETVEGAFSEARRATRAIAETNTRMRNRSWYEYFPGEGLVNGPRTDRRVATKADEHREVLRQTAESWGPSFAIDQNTPILSIESSVKRSGQNRKPSSSDKHPQIAAGTKA